MNLVRLHPWSVNGLMRRDFDRRANRRFGCAPGESGVAEWVPAVDIIEEKDRFVLRADVPGVEREAIDVSMHDGVLSISGERHGQQRDEIDGIQRFERASGRFLRRFTMPETANAEEIAAKIANGILEITILKLPEVQARRIEVEAA
jgi:HSP20 family protein